MASDAEAHIWGALGASGSGKGLWVKGRLRALKPRRLIVWDYMSEYQEFTGEAPDATSRATLEDVRKAMVKAGKDGPLKIRYEPRGASQKQAFKEFEALCNLVYAWGNCTFVVEELANVTMPSWAPWAWGKMSTSGRHKLVHIIGCTQSPAFIDKKFLGNCTLIHCGPLGEDEHRKSAAKSMNIRQTLLDELVKFQWVEKDKERGEVTTGWVAPPGQRAKPARALATTEASPTGRGKRTPSVPVRA